MSRNLRDDDAPILPSPSDSPPPQSKWKRYFKLFAVKPITVFYACSFLITGSVTSQLWIDRTCRVDLAFNETICANLSSKEYDHYNDIVQTRVSEYNAYGTYFDLIQILSALYLGPWSDQGRKPTLLLPFLGHVISGVIPILLVYFKTWPARVLYATNVYSFFGGYSLLTIAMNGYIGDVTTARERTTILSILQGVGLVFFPLVEFLGGQLFKYGGYYPVFGASLGATFLGIVYVILIPESVTRRMNAESSKAEERATPWHKVPYHMFVKGNKLVVESVRCAIKRRDPGVRPIVLSLLGISIFSRALRRGGNGLLYVEKKFGWDVVTYTNFHSVTAVIAAFEAFVVTTFYSYFVGMHDCLVSAFGNYASAAAELVQAFATKGWMMYYAYYFMLFLPVSGAPLKSILSKCVGVDEFGKLFTVSTVLPQIFSMAFTSLTSLLYAATVDTFPGASYVLGAGIEYIVMAMTLGLYYMVRRHEKVYGELGRGQNAHLTRKSDDRYKGI